MDGRWAIALIVIAVCVAGCKSSQFYSLEPVAQFGSYSAPPAKPQTPFEVYAAAAVEAQQLAAPMALRAEFTPGQKAQIIRTLDSPLRKVSSTPSGDFHFDFQVLEPHSAHPFRPGWRLLGKGLSWRISLAVQQRRYDDAVADCINATRFGFDLMNGDVMDAFLGMAIVDDARQALLPAFGELDSEQLARLSKGLRSALLRKPAGSTTLRNEGANMLASVELIRQKFMNGRLGDLRSHFGPDVALAINYLSDVKLGSEKAKNYFEGFAKEIDADIEYLVQSSTMPARKRETQRREHLADYRPWRRFSRHLVTSGNQFLIQRDRTLARSRLFAIEAALLSQVKAIRRAPETLAGFGDIVQDPFTGDPFIYRASGPDYVIYSVGADFKDDMGETDQDFLRPDLTIERSLR
ncbi:MAG: hypothetical protein ACK4P3_08415 [Fimbriimonadaceae bacterium]